MDNVKKISLTQGREVLVDAIDFDRLNQYRWYANRFGATWCARRNACSRGRRITLYMHREILNLESDNQKSVDHKNHNGLDNRRTNLRLCTASMNGMNRQSHKKFSSQFKGVCWHKWRQKWVAKIRKNGKRYYLGYFQLEKEAAQAYNNAARELFGEFKHLNTVDIGEKI